MINEYQLIAIRTITGRIMGKIFVKSLCVLLSSTLFSSTILLTSCTGRDPRPIQTSQVGDKEKSCSTLETEMENIDKDILERFPNASKSGSNTGLGIAGVFLIVPWFFMDFSKADEIEVSALIDRHNHLLLTSQENSCASKRERIPTIVEMQRQAKAANKDKYAQ
jgi:hypothetical protein|tara:strand:- start:603 stop:1097 length:495 start_codon:yes stop_codon:yes gene_type:complete